MGIEPACLLSEAAPQIAPHTQTHTHTLTQTHKQTHTGACTHTHAHAHSHTHTHRRDRVARLFFTIVHHSRLIIAIYIY